MSHIIVSMVRLERPQVSIKLEALPLSYGTFPNVCVYGIRYTYGVI